VSLSFSVMQECPMFIVDGTAYLLADANEDFLKVVIDKTAYSIFNEETLCLDFINLRIVADNDEIEITTDGITKKYNVSKTEFAKAALNNFNLLLKLSNSSKEIINDIMRAYNALCYELISA